jgi:hypothetical protein
MRDLLRACGSVGDDGALLFLTSEASARANGVLMPVHGGNHLPGM